MKKINTTPIEIQNKIENRTTQQIVNENVTSFSNPTMDVNLTMAIKDPHIIWTQYISLINYLKEYQENYSHIEIDLLLSELGYKEQ
jgi:hypothetical protein